MNAVGLKKTSSILALVWALFAVSEAAVVNVYFAGGQSNATQVWGDAAEAELLENDPVAVLVWTNHPGNALRRWHTTYDLNGTLGRQENYLKDFYNPDSVQEGLLEATFASIESAGDTPVLKGMLWFQGEGDRLLPESVDNNGYYEEFLALKSRIEQDFSVSFLPVCLAVVQVGPPAEVYSIASIRAQQWDLGSLPGMEAYDTIELDRQTDGVHLLTAAATRAGTNMMEILLGIPPPLAGEISSVSILQQDFNPDLSGFTLDFNSGTLECTGTESPFTALDDSLSLHAKNSGATGNPSIESGMAVAETDVVVRVSFDYCRRSLGGAQTFFLRDSVNTIGIHLFLNGSNAGEVMNFGGDVLTTLAQDRWYHFELSIAPQGDAVKTFDLVISDTNGVVAISRELSFRNAIDRYDKVQWFFNTEGSSTSGQYDLDNVLVGVAAPEHVILAQDLNTNTNGLVLDGNDGYVGLTNAESIFTGTIGWSLVADNTVDPGDGPNANLNPEIRSDHFDVGSATSEALRIGFDYYEDQRSTSTTFMLRSGTASTNIGIQLVLGALGNGSVQVVETAGMVDTEVDLALDAWYRVEITASPEGETVKSFNLTIIDATTNVVLSSTYDFRNDISDYQDIRWVFNSQSSQDNGSFLIDNVFVETIPEGSAVFEQRFDSETDGLVLNVYDGVITGGGPESLISGIDGGASLDAANTGDEGPWNLSVRTDPLGIVDSTLPLGIAFDYFIESYGGNQTFQLRSGSTSCVHLVLSPGQGDAEVENVTTTATEIGISLSTGMWYRIEILAPAEEASENYELIIKDVNGDVYTGTLPFRNNLSSYDDLQWNFNTVGSNNTGRFHVDNVRVAKVYIGTEWHVAPNGFNEGEGSSSEPFSTIQRAAELADAGDTVTIHGGTYAETVVVTNSGTSTDPIVFESCPGEDVVVSGLETVPSGAWTEHGNGIYKAHVQMTLGDENQVFRNPESVRVWRDRSGNENHAVQVSTVSRPGANSTVVFDGTNDFLETPVGHLSNGGFLMVGNFAVQGAANASVVLSWQESGGDPGTSYSFESYSSSTVVSMFNNPTGGIFRNYTDGIANAKPAVGSWHVMGGTVTGNGADTATTLRIGGNHNDSNFPDGNLRELIVWDVEISDANRQKIEGYLAHKWGLEGNLAVAHPYKAAPPVAFDPAELSGVAAWYDADLLATADEMMFEARWPNSLDVWNPVWATADNGTTPSSLVDSALPNYDWTGSTLWINQDPAWSLYGQQVLGYGSGQLVTENNIVWENHQLTSGSSYYVQGCLDALDIEGEWYYDPATETLFVHVGGGSPGNDIHVKSRMNAFVLDGLSHVELNGIRIQGATVTTDENSSHLVMDGLSVEYPYFSSNYDSWQTTDGLVLNGDGHVFRNSELGWASGCGLIINGDSAQVVNNHIHDCDFIGSYAAPLKLGAETKNGLISHNTITMAGRSCVAFSWPIRDYLFQNNDLSHAGQLTKDLGMTYVNICEAGGMELRYNWVHDNDADHIASGIYFDHGAKNLLIHHNAIWGVDTGGILINQYAMGVLMFNNTVTSDVGFRSIWGNEWPDDMYGCKLINNVFNSTIITDGDEIEIVDNTTNYTGLVDYKYLTTGSGPIDAGRIIPGITDGYSGGAPDQGAYETGGADWQAGHDFRGEPVVNSSLTDCPYMNRIVNSCFEWSSVAPWTVSGPDVALNAQTVNQGMVLTNTAMGGSRSLRLGAGTNRVEQTLTNLLPNAMYEFRGRLRADAGEDVVIGVSGYGFAEVISAEVTGNAPNWSDTRIWVATASDITSATIYAEKTSTGTGNVYVDDFSVIYQHAYFGQDFNTNTNGVTLNANGGVLDRTGSESTFSGIAGGESLEADNTSATGNPEIRVDGIDMSRVDVGEPLRILFDYYRAEAAGAQTFFLQDTVAPITGNGNGIQLQLNASNLGRVINFDSTVVLATLAVDTWYRFEIVVVPETNTVKTFDLTIRDNNSVVASHTALPFRYSIDSYNRAKWFFNTANSNVQGNYYLDNVAVTGVAYQNPDPYQAYASQSIFVPEGLPEPDVDTDGDGLSNWAELLAGTDSENPDSVLALIGMTPTVYGGFEFQWWSEPEKTYSIAACTSLVEPIWLPIKTGILATPPVNTETVEKGFTEESFFRVELE